MSDTSHISTARLKQLLTLAKFGWWKADFEHKHYVCSEYIVQMLGLDSEILGFGQFQQLIRQDYRDQITKEFASIQTEEIYEQTFPLQTQYGEIWIHSQLGKKEKDESGNLIAWGYLQCITDPQKIKAEQALKKFNIQIHQQTNISRSLTHFLQTEDTHEVIYKILQNLLEQFQASRAYIIEYDKEKQIQKYTFQVLANDLAPQEPQTYIIPLKNMPWWTNQLTSRLPILLSNLDELPKEAIKEKKILAQRGIKSLMAIPMIAQDQVWGYMGIDTINHYRTWSYEDYQWLATLGNIISICMELHKTKNKVYIEREYFKSIYTFMPIGYVRMKLLYQDNNKLYDYKFLDLNPAFSDITGLPVTKFIGKTAREILSDKIVEHQLKDLRKMKDSPSFTQINFKAIKKDQYYRCITYSQGTDEMIVLFSDYTETQKVHEALDRSEKELWNIYNNIPVGIEIYDKDGNLRDMNKKNTEILGIKDKEMIIGLNLFENPYIPESIKQQIRKQKNVDFKTKYDLNNRSRYYSSQQNGIKDLIIKVSYLYNSRDELENYMLIIIDNTETFTAYSKIQEFENFFSIIADFAKVGYFKWNLHKKKGFALDQWFKNWGEPANSKLENVIGIYNHLHPADRPKIMQLYQQFITGQIKGSKEEIRIDNGKGGWKWIRSTVVLTKYDPEHQDIELIGVNFDITELKEIEAKLIEAKNKAETLDKLKSAFLANMSHEIRTPLNAIVGFSNLLAETNELEEQHQYISIIQENNDLLLQLISDILDLSKIEAGTFEIVQSEIDVNMLCHEIVRSLNMKTLPGVQLEFEHCEPICHIQSDRNRLMQVITNFINNAIKFTSSGSIRLGYYVQNQEIEFYVQDSGIGIPTQKINSVFERFVKLNSFIHGTGLGLSICKSIVEQMGGRIGVSSEEGKGSRFWFALPFITPTPQSCPLADKPSTSAPVRTFKTKPVVLIAEDVESNFILISSILKKEYIILWAQNGKEALEIYNQHHPDIILMDIQMPEMDGLEATRHIRQQNTEIPIIALTAFAFDADKNTTLEAGCNAYLSKPINASLLKQNLVKLLER